MASAYQNLNTNLEKIINFNNQTQSAIGSSIDAAAIEISIPTNVSTADSPSILSYDDVIRPITDIANGQPLLPFFTAAENLPLAEKWIAQVFEFFDGKSREKYNDSFAQDFIVSNGDDVVLGLLTSGIVEKDDLLCMVS